MREILYSFIIPHHNCPTLLETCLKSIPQRDDIQVIVVDDNSDYGKKPVIKREDVEIVYLNTEESKGAGHARNVGLSKALGEWLFFPDADDFYKDGFLDVLLPHLTTDIDILYFGFYNNYNVQTKNIEETPYNQYIEEYIKNRSIKFYQNNIKYGISAAWNKVFRRDFILKNKLQFEEIFAGNDIRFVHTAGSLTSRIETIQDKLYYYVKNPKSITYKKVPFENLVERTKTAASHIRFIQNQGAWNLANYSWPPLSIVYADYGMFSTLKIALLKLKLYRPSQYVKFKANQVLKANKKYRL